RSASLRWWPSPARRPVGLALTSLNDREQLSVTMAAKVLAAVPVADLEQAVRDRLKDSTLELELRKSGDRQPAVTLDGQTAYVPILKPIAGGLQYRGMLSLSLTDSLLASISS